MTRGGYAWRQSPGSGLWRGQRFHGGVARSPAGDAGFFTRKTGHNTIFDLTLGGENTKAMIVDWQYEPIKGSLLHIDLKRIAMDK